MWLAQHPIGLIDDKGILVLDIHKRYMVSAIEIRDMHVQLDQNY